MVTPRSNRQEIIDLARSSDLVRHRVQAVVLFGSRAKGTAAPDSDWDLAFLVDHPEVKHVTSLQNYWPDNPFRNHRDVNACVLSVTYLKTHMYNFGQISHQIARYGEPLLGEWEVNREFLDKMTRSRPDDWDRYLNESYQNLRNFLHAVRDFKLEEDARHLHSIVNVAIMTSQRAAEYLVKGIVLRRYIEPRKSHDIAGLADDLLHQKPHEIDATQWSAFAKRIPVLDGYSTQDNQAAYEVRAPDEATIHRACARIANTVTLFADEVASALRPPYPLAIMGLTAKSSGDQDYRERLNSCSVNQWQDLQRLRTEGREVLAMPSQEKRPCQPNRDIGGVLELPRYLELLRQPLTLNNQREITTNV